MKISYCTECLMPDSRPRIEFDARGVCNACLHAERKRVGIDWNQRRDEFLQYVEKYRPKTGPYDCIVPWSGGKDSSAIAHKLKFDFGLNPLLVTFSPLIPNEVGRSNREELLRLGFDHLFVRPNQKVSRRLTRRFFIERGNPKVHWDAGINAVPLQVAVRYKIPLVFYAEHGETEYGGRVLDSESQKIRDFTEVIEHQIGDDPLNWVDEEISTADLAPYLYPSAEDLSQIDVKAMYFAYFFKWSMKENYEYIKTKMRFNTAPSGRTDGTFTDFDSLDDKIDNIYYYMQYIKFGFGRCVRDVCRHIQNRQMTRAEGLELVRKYDHEYPASFLSESLEYMGFTENEFNELVDRHRNSEIWTQKDGDWLLTHPPE